MFGLHGQQLYAFVYSWRVSHHGGESDEVYKPIIGFEESDAWASEETHKTRITSRYLLCGTCHDDAAFSVSLAG